MSDSAPVQTSFASRLAPVLPVLLALALSGCLAAKQRKADAVVEDHIMRGRYREAVDYAARIAADRPDDERAQDRHRLATVAFLLERGRRLTFERQDTEALVYFQQAFDLAPEHEDVVAWYSKTKDKLANIWYERAWELHAEEKLEQAVAAYEQSLAYRPDYELADQGLARALIQINYRKGLSDDYYNEGVRSLQEYFLQVARSRFLYSKKYKPGDVRPERRTDEVNKLIAEQRLAVARKLEEDGYYAAAHNEYRLALVLDKTNEEAIAGRERMAVESEVTRRLDSADMMILRDEWSRARQELEGALEITIVQSGRIDDLIADIDEARMDATYQRALNCEHDFRYEDAIAIYKQILEEREYFENTRSRLETLEDYVVKADELYRQARETNDPQARFDILRQIEIFWPEYLDIQDQLTLLREQLDSRATNASANAVPSVATEDAGE